MTSSYDRPPSSRRLIGLAVVVVLHIFLFYALVSGLARDVVEIVKRPLETKIITEIPPPPPPPPPPPKQIVKQQPAPKVEAPPPPFVPPPEIVAPPSVAPPITVAVEPPKVEYQMEPPAPPPAPPAPPAAARQDIGVACPGQVKPEMPRKALQEGTSGVVRAQVRISGGGVKEVTILSGPRVFHAPVRAAMLAYKCASNDVEVLAVQEFAFKAE